MDRRTSRALITRLNNDAELIARRFALRYRSIRAERANVKSRYGICYADGAIKIRLCHVSTGKPLKYSSLVNTLCHELAHLEHFNHGERFRAFYLQLLEYARIEGIYQPGLRRDAGSGALPPAARKSTPAPGPEQLALF